MASPQQAYSDGPPDPEGGQSIEDGQYEQPSSPQQANAVPAGGRVKKRAYAGQAYEFGAGANSALGGQQTAGAGYPGSPVPAAGGYGQQAQQQPSYGMPPQPSYGDPSTQTPAAQPAYGQPQYGAPQGGYEPAQSAGYQPPGGQPGVQGVQQQFQQMNVGGQQPQQPGQAQAMRLNPLQPVDISMQGQPFHVTDLDQPPPPIILPPNVSFTPQKPGPTQANVQPPSPPSRPLPTPTARLSTSAAPSMPCPPPPLY